MAQLTDLNVSPYYDDFDKTDNFNKVLFVGIIPTFKLI